MEKILTIDIGNTNIATCLWDGDKMNRLKSFQTDLNASFEALKDSFLSVLMSYEDNKKTELIAGSVISCVVPSIAETAKEALSSVTGHTPVMVSHELDLGINFDLYDKKSLGADRIVDVVGAVQLYKAPVIVCDLGTCTTISAVDSNKNFIGGLICPGVQTSLNALHSRVPHLPEITAAQTDTLIGQDTSSALLSGAVVGTASMLAEITDRLCKAPEMKGASLILTGGNAPFVFPWIGEKEKAYHEPDLIMKGLREIYTNFC